MKYDVTLNGKVYEVEVERGEAILVSVNDVPAAVVPAAVAAPAPVAAAPAAAPAPVAVAGGEVVSSPMPGTILGVSVNEGDTVKKGQILLVLEAMKMENEIMAPRDGKVAQVMTAKGAKVETGAPLLTLA